MRVLTWLFRAFLFLAALGFALSNTRITELRFFGFDFVWSAPLVIFLLIFFVTGVVVGLLAVVPVLYRQRREIARLRREQQAGAKASPTTPPLADVPRSGAATDSPARAGS